MNDIWRRRFAPGYQRMKRPVMAYQFDYTHGSREIWHSHEQGQLVYCAARRGTRADAAGCLDGGADKRLLDRARRGP